MFCDLPRNQNYLARDRNRIVLNKIHIDSISQTHAVSDAVRQLLLENDTLVSLSGSEVALRSPLGPPIHTFTFAPTIASATAHLLQT